MICSEKARKYGAKKWRRLFRNLKSESLENWKRILTSQNTSEAKSAAERDTFVRLHTRHVQSVRLINAAGADTLITTPVHIKLLNG